MSNTELIITGPTRTRYGRLMLPFAGILLVMNTAQTGVGSVLIPNRIAELAPADKTTVFGLVMGAGAATSPHCAGWRSSSGASPVRRWPPP